MASSATPLHDSLIELAIPDAHAHAIKWYLNVYFPADYGTSDSNNEFLDTIAELEGFLSSHEYDNVIICGDFNVDFCRPGHNHDHLMSFMRDYNLTSLC